MLSNYHLEASYGLLHQSVRAGVHMLRLLNIPTYVCILAKKETPTVVVVVAVVAVVASLSFLRFLFLLLSHFAFTRFFIFIYVIKPFLLTYTSFAKCSS